MKLSHSIKHFFTFSRRQGIGEVLGLSYGFIPGEEEHWGRKLSNLRGAFDILLRMLGALKRRGFRESFLLCILRLRKTFPGKNANPCRVHEILLRKEKGARAPKWAMNRVFSSFSRSVITSRGFSIKNAGELGS